jgi:type IX secretion system PorP/SprF family membrane protein
MRQWYIKIVLLFCFAATAFIISAQQLPASSHLGATRIAWNPAYTAAGNELTADVFFRMQWLGFDGAPVSGFSSVQLPFNDLNMSVGGMVHFDKTGPLRKTGLQLSYAYKLKQLLGKYDQLSVGLAGNFQQYVVNTTNLAFKDQGDLLIAGQNSNTNFLSLGSGLYYVSNTREYKGNSFFAGLAINQLYASPVLLSEFNQPRQNHFHINTGGRFYMLDSYIEPMFTANIVNPAIVDLLFGLKYEKEDTFWAGLGYGGAGMAAFQAGVYVNNFGNKYGRLKIGCLGNYGVNSSELKALPGFEFYMAYTLVKGSNNPF